MHRVLVSPPQLLDSTITLDDPAQTHHLRDVLRLRTGDRVVCFDGEGHECAGVIVAQRREQVVIELTASTREIREGATIWLAQSLLKGERFEWVIQKATELGVSRLSPLVTQHTVIRITEGQAQKKHERWQRLAQEAAKQCQRATIPAIDPPATLEHLLPRMEPLALVLMPTLASTTIPLDEALKGQTLRALRPIGPEADAREVALLIGPEGDFSREEVVLAQAYGARPVSLGRLTLRAETAALAALSMIKYALGDL